MKKPIFIAIGCICLALGAIGVVIPILPTVPFLLLTAFCFAQSSQRLNDWFVSTKLYKNNLESYAKGQGMTWHNKIRIMVTVTLLMGLGFLMMTNVPIGRIVLAIVWICHIIYFTFIVKTPDTSKP